KAYQLSKSGGMQEIPVPEGFVPAPQTQYLDTGTAFMPMDKRTGQGIADPVAKDVAGVAAEKLQGETQAQAQIDLPTIQDNAKVAKDVLRQIKEHPALKTVTGLSGTIDP